MLENRPMRLGLPTRTKTERTAAHHLRDERHDFDLECQDDTAPQASISEPLRRDDIINSRLRVLEAATSRLRREAELESRRLQAILDELALAAERGNNATLAHTIRMAAAGPPDQSSGAVCAPHGERDCARCRSPGPVQALSNREREVLGLLTNGSRSPCIAARLNICVATVEVHRRNIIRKLGLHTVAALTKYAVREGLTSL
ncbi:MAG TPA: LuxR C-terminal-related transcriptional regulator [Steroidobacteraceae bacterium]